MRTSNAFWTSPNARGSSVMMKRMSGGNTDAAAAAGMSTSSSTNLQSGARPTSSAGPEQRQDHGVHAEEDLRQRVPETEGRDPADEPSPVAGVDHGPKRDDQCDGHEV